jgi:aspartyl-tRNA(Asn)/glutamyl-tRNA(Gln) amidotransferase subunit B
VTDADIERVRAALPEAPGARRARWERELGLSEYDAGVLSASRALADFFEETARLAGAAAAKEAANWIANDVAAALSAAGASSPEELRLTPERLAGMLALLADGAIGRAGAKQLLAAMTTRGGAPAVLVQELGLAQVRDASQVEEWCRAALGANPKAAADVRAGEGKALGPLVGAVMKASAGRAAPDEVRATLLRLIAETPA